MFLIKRKKMCLLDVYWLDGDGRQESSKLFCWTPCIKTIYFRILSPGKTNMIEVKAQPFQQTSQPEGFKMGIFSATIFMGMIFVLVPVSLAIDVVYDREVCVDSVALTEKLN